MHTCAGTLRFVSCTLPHTLYTTSHITSPNLPFKDKKKNKTATPRHTRASHLHRRIATNVHAELVHELVQCDNGGVLEVVRKAQRHVHLANGHADAQALEVLDGVPLPVGVVQHVSGIQIGVLQGQVRGELGHEAVAGHHVHLAAAQGVHVGGVLGVQEEPALAADGLDEPVVARGAVPARAGGLSGIVGALAHDQLGAEVGGVGLGAESLPNALVDLQVLQHHLVDAVLQVLQRAQLAVVEGEAGLHGEEHVHLGVGVVHDLREGLLEGDHHAVVLHGVVLGVSNNGDLELTDLGRQVAINTPLVESRGAGEHVLDHHGTAPVLGQLLQLLHGEVSVLDGRNVLRLIGLLGKLKNLVPGSSSLFSVRGEQKKIGVHVGESIAGLNGLPNRKQ
eukprot:Colp12_sorted_trinity150504_noHs@29682